ncbi:MAG: DUF2807 domain-containing protein [Muribaculaceae bacterium]|nr:DUF2807 domain-containing protein [Muribaculaceae bacterium]
MKLLKTYLTAVILLLAAVVGEARNPNEYVFNIGQFNKIEIDDNVNVIYRCVPDSTGYAAFSGEQEFADAFILTNNNGSLHVQVNTEDVGRPNLPTLHLYSDFLTTATNSSISTLRIESPAPVSSFTARQVGNGKIIAENIRATNVNGIIATGNGKVNISGLCDRAEFKMVGTGKIMADRLHAEDVKCIIVGGGEIGCWPIHCLQVKGIGSTKIFYKGDPVIKKKGGGKLFALPDSGTFAK